MRWRSRPFPHLFLVRSPRHVSHSQSYDEMHVQTPCEQLKALTTDRSEAEPIEANKVQTRTRPSRRLGPGSTASPAAGSRQQPPQLRQRIQSSATPARELSLICCEPPMCMCSAPPAVSRGSISVVDDPSGPRRRGRGKYKRGT